MSDFKKTVAWAFFKESELSLAKIYKGSKLKIDPAPLYKVYRTEHKFPLKDPLSTSKPIIDILKERRSTREYLPEPISFEELSTILWASQGITRKINGFALRTAPSAGALYPIETYLSVKAVRDIPPGIYHLNLKEFALELLQQGDFSYYIARAALNQYFMAEASVVVCWSAVFRRTMSKYGERGMRYIFMDVGHICQNLLLVAESLDLAACPVGAFLDNEMNKLFGLNKEEEAMVYCVSIGKKV